MTPRASPTTLHPKFSCDCIILRTYSIFKTFNTTYTAHTPNRLAYNPLTICYQHSCLFIIGNNSNKKHVVFDQQDMKHNKHCSKSISSFVTNFTTTIKFISLIEHLKLQQSATTLYNYSIFTIPLNRRFLHLTLKPADYTEHVLRSNLSFYRKIDFSKPSLAYVNINRIFVLSFFVIKN